MIYNSIEMLYCFVPTEKFHYLHCSIFQAMLLSVIEREALSSFKK